MGSSHASGRLDRIVDSVLDAAVVPGFRRIGYAVRSRGAAWRGIDTYDLTGRRIVISGVTSGLGAATARQLRSIGADLVIIGRDAGRTEQAATALRTVPGPGTVEVVLADMGELRQVRVAGEAIIASGRSVDVVVHNAGALLGQRTLTSEQNEVTIATHVLGPFQLTMLLLGHLKASAGRVITVASGGMYAAPLPDIDAGETLEMSPASYNGTRQYAIAKRAQVTLNEMWATEQPAVHFQAMHPGWADTPGVKTSLPTFGRLLKPVLRTPEEGADTVCWLAADDEGAASSGGFWCDRAQRPIHRLPTTRHSDSASARAALWQWCRTTCELSAQ